MDNNKWAIIAGVILVSVGLTSYLSQDMTPEQKQEKYIRDMVHSVCGNAPGHFVASVDAHIVCDVP